MILLDIFSVQTIERAIPVTATYSLRWVGQKYIRGLCMSRYGI